MTSLGDLPNLADLQPVKVFRPLDPRITESLSGQERCFWCWAAVAQFALRWAKLDREQCCIATQHFSCDHPENAPECCDEGACNERESLRLVLQRQGCLVERLFVPTDISTNQLQELRAKVLEKLDGKDPEPVAFRVQSSDYWHYIVCNGLVGETVLIEDPCGPQYTCEPEASFLGKMLYNGELDITNVYFLRKSDGSFQCL